MDSNKEWITDDSTPDPTQIHNSNSSLPSNTLDLDSSKLLITIDQQYGRKKIRERERKERKCV